MTENKKWALEAILFAAGDPILKDRAREALDLDEPSFEKCLHELEDDYDYNERGIRLVRLGDFLQLTSRENYEDVVKTALGKYREATLSPAALEVLAITAYNQPVTKGYIEQVRGVDCSGVVNSLLERGFLEERGKLDVPGHPRLFATTPEFLRCFGLSSLEELPPLEEAETEGKQEKIEL